MRDKISAKNARIQLLDIICVSMGRKPKDQTVYDAMNPAIDNLIEAVEREFIEEFVGGSNSEDGPPVDSYGDQLMTTVMRANQFKNTGPVPDIDVNGEP